MFTAKSLLETANIYMVENIFQTLVAFILVWGLILLFRIRNPAFRANLLFLAMALPLVGPPLFYLAVPSRASLPLLPLDRLLALSTYFDAYPWWQTMVTLLTLALGLTLAFLLAKGALSLLALWYLPRHLGRLEPGQHPQFEAMLSQLLERGGMERPVVLVSVAPGYLCATMGLLRPYLVLSREALRGLAPAELRAVLAHELAHIQRRDSRRAFLLTSLSHILCFNPMAWALRRQILLETELAADQGARAMGIAGYDYAHSLIQFSQRSAAQALGVGSPFGDSHHGLKRRLQEALKAAPRGPVRHHSLGLAGAASLVLVATFLIC
ncbi:MAG: M56 family metallopeptidase [Chloroflexi bacterium]|nr:M56 family metallopeptidase [Chloroflexota bacterium]